LVALPEQATTAIQLPSFSQTSMTFFAQGKRSAMKNFFALVSAQEKFAAQLAVSSAPSGTRYRLCFGERKESITRTLAQKKCRPATR
jgi:hypothetical protein